MTKILGIIQARYSSSRLEGKVMLPIVGKPIVWHIYNRISSCKKINEICLATSTSHADDQIVKFTEMEKIPYFRGSEEMVLDRLIGAAQKFQADAIVRITADCPLIDPKIVDNIISLYLSNPNMDFASNTIERTFPDGLDTEVISTKFLVKLSKKLRDSFTRSWFPMHMIENHKQYFCSNYKNQINLSHLRWTLDYLEDYEFIKQVYQHLYSFNKIFDMAEILSLLEKKPEINKINSKYQSNTSKIEYDNLKKKTTNGAHSR